jgi:hypothetical protein
MSRLPVLSPPSPPNHVLGLIAPGVLKRCIRAYALVHV